MPSHRIPGAATRWARALARPLPIALGLAGPLLMAQAVASPAWQYQGDNGPDQWGRLRPAWAVCASGQRQSPVDIVGAQRKAAGTLRFDYRAAPLRIVNDGHTVRVRYANGSRLLVGQDAHTLQQFHFHTPGGDRLGGEEFPMAMHLLHKSGSGRLVSLVLLFRLGAENPALAELLPRMPAAGQPEQTLPGPPFNPSALLPASTAHFRYDGSLTAPPCTEGVGWIVMKQLFPPNARPVQPLHGRLVTEGD